MMLMMQMKNTVDFNAKNETIRDTNNDGTQIQRFSIFPI